MPLNRNRLPSTYGAAALCGASLLVASSVSAGLYPDPIANPGFQNPAITDANFNPVTEDWAQENRSSTQDDDPDTVPTPPDDPDQWGVFFGSDNGAFYQEIGTFEANLALDVTLDVGDRPNFPFGGLVVELWGGGDSGSAGKTDADSFESPTGPDGVDGGGDDGEAVLLSSLGAVLLDSATFTPPTGFDVDTGEGNFVTNQVFSLNTGPAGAIAEGDELWLRITGTVDSPGRSQTLVDQIGIAVVPEPASLSLLGLGGLTLLRRRRRQ